VYYLSHHLVAVRLAMGCATAGDDESAKIVLEKALFAEAFAAHFLTDMFSSAHSRVPRWYIIDSEGADSSRGAMIARVLHQHEGRLGVFLTNASGQVWYAMGDAHVLDASRVSGLGAPLTPWPNSKEPLGYAEMLQLAGSEQLRPDVLAGSLVYASLVDVLRHCSKGFIETQSVRGGTEPSGLLGYILARCPFALSTAGMGGDKVAALRTTFNALVDKMHMATRLADRKALYETYAGIAKDVGIRGKPFLWWDDVLYSDQKDFEKAIGGGLTEEAGLKWSRAQADHVTTLIMGVLGTTPTFLSVPMMLIGDYSFDKESTDWIKTVGGMPPEWIKAVPATLIDALTQPTGVWQIKP